MTPDLRCDRLSKRYRLRARRRAATTVFARAADVVRHPTEEFWALRDVSFEVARGETLGVIGRNGAGKSTLLKLLSGITAPSEGEITIVGRLSALIEVGSGFHPELTGRENTFLTGSILGMRRRDIAARLDEIVAFSGVEAFLDIPVKYYSSGMYVRLGFAIAAHLEPDVLLVDEVLAVGDADFQARCLRRVQDLKQRGTTMVLVSHDLGAVEQLADRAVLLDHGMLAASGTPHEVISAYQRAATAPAGSSASASGEAGVLQDAAFRIEALTLHGPDGRALISATHGSPVVASVTLTARERTPATVTLSIFEFDSGTLLTEFRAIVDPVDTAEPTARLQVDFMFPDLLLTAGAYTLGVTVTPAGAQSPVAWRFGRTTMYVEGGGPARGTFVHPCTCRVSIQRSPLLEPVPVT